MRILKKAAHPAFRFGSLVFFECDLHERLPGVRPVAGILVREAFTSDIDLFVNPEQPSLRGIALERFRRGERCFAGIDTSSGKLANYRWVTSTAGYLPEI